MLTGLAESEQYKGAGRQQPDVLVFGYDIYRQYGIVGPSLD